MANDSRRWMNVAALAAALGKSKRFIRSEVNAGRLRAARLGGRGEIFSCPEWLDAYMESQAAPVVVNVRRRA